MHAVREFPQWCRRVLLHRSFVAWCFAAFVVIRLILVVALPLEPTSDAAWYVVAAHQLAEGKGYLYAKHPTAFWPVGFPFYLAMIFWVAGPSVLVAELMNLVLSCGVFFLTYQTSRIVFDSLMTARLAILLLTIYPNQIAYTTYLGPEILGTVLLMLGTIVIMQRMTPARSILSGLIFGVATLVRAQFLLIPGILLWIFWRTSGGGKTALLRAVAAGALMGGAMLCVILPWSARNYLVFHHFVLVSTNGGVTFLTGNNPQANGDYTPNSPLFAAATNAGGDEVAVDQRAYALGTKWIRDNPLQFAELVPLKIWRLWAPDGDAEWNYQLGFPGYADHALAFHGVRIMNQLYYGLLLLAMAGGLWRLFRMRGAQSGWAQLGLWLILYTTAISMVFSGQSRFHFPVMPWVIIYAAWFLDAVTGVHWQESDDRRSESSGRRFLRPSAAQAP